MAHRPRSYSSNPNEDPFAGQYDQYDTGYGGHTQQGYAPVDASQHNAPYDAYQPYQAYQPPAVPQHGNPAAYHDDMYNNRGHEDPFLDPDVGARRGLESYNGASTPGLTPHSRSPNRGSYHDRDPFNRSGALGMEDIDPHGIADDGDDDIPVRQGQRRSFLPAASAAGGALGGMAAGATAGYSPMMGGNRPSPEKGTWLKDERSRGKKVKWIIIGIIVLVVLGVIGGVAGYFITQKDSSDSSDTDTDKGLDINSDEIQDLMNNDDLHKVFPGMDYTPLNAQYPDCLHYPPSQDNITMDVAVLSQLTNVIRLYGTDCGQTEKVLTAIDRLDMTDTMQVWMGVWLDKNQTTNDRQIKQMWDIFDNYGSDGFAGVIVGNEILFRKDMTEGELSSKLTEVKSEMQKRGIDVPLATSDLGSSWSKYPQLADAVDVVMSNIHPFFGKNVNQAATWTWEFYRNNDLPVIRGTDKRSLIAETGWPSQGGMDGSAIAGIDEMNTFLDTFVCQSMGKNIDFFWFEAFDEPWKIKFDRKGAAWEDHWGLMDVDRNLKDGLVIPDCSGQTVDKRK